MPTLITYFYVIKILTASASGMCGSTTIVVNSVELKKLSENNRIYIFNRIEYVNNKIKY